jgi:Xaa-Pro aminopeptidase
MRIMQDRDREAGGRLKALRMLLRSSGLDGFIVPKADEFQNESVPAYADRLAWLTGFTGSAGCAIVLEDKAALLADSRYTLQAKAQVSQKLYTVEPAPKVTIASYLAANARNGAVIGYDPALHTVAGFEQVRREAAQGSFKLKAWRRNPIDRLWKNRPPEVHAPIFVHKKSFAGESAASKLDRVRQAIKEKEANALFISAPDAVAWLFNIRGRDVAHTPVPLVRALVRVSGKPVLFVSNGHITEENRKAIEAMAILEDIRFLDKDLTRLAEPGKKVIASPSSATLKIFAALKKAKAKVVEAPDPCVLLRAKKNAVELQGAREAQARDGAAMCRFLAWLDAHASAGKIDELGASDKLEAFRRESNLFEDSSFDTISGAGPNGAIVHYRATPETNRRLLPGTLYLVDSGAQYPDGTTDVTRTVAIGGPTDEMRRHYTLVLKGHIAIATARFPAGTRGIDLDSFARRALWEAGLDYGHGTGHGVGSFLSVHEGPQSISRHSMTELEPGMVLSNEPGYYREGHYGIRLENLLVVSEAESAEGGEIPVMSFETLTLAPFDRRLIAPELLSAGELAWLNAYHARVWREISPALNGSERKWLKEAAAPL